MSGIFGQRAETLKSFTLWWLGTTTTSGPERAAARIVTGGAIISAQSFDSCIGSQLTSV